MLPPVIYPLMKLFYREKGDASLPTLIILHGLWGASDNWLPIAEHLSTQFHVILPDFRNHGHSPHAEEHTYPALAKDICDWIGNLHLPTAPFIAGHSMGGKCLMHLLLQHPDIAAKAAIIDIAPKRYEKMEEHLQIINFIKQFVFDKKESRSMLYRRIRDNVKDERLCQVLLKNIDKEETGFKWKINVQAILKHLPAITGWTAPTGKCIKPILFIRAEASNYIQPEDIPHIKSIFPHASFITINEADHWIHTQQPSKLANAMKCFFGG